MTRSVAAAFSSIPRRRRRRQAAPAGPHVTPPCTRSAPCRAELGGQGRCPAAGHTQQKIAVPLALAPQRLIKKADPGRVDHDRLDDLFAELGASSARSTAPMAAIACRCRCNPARKAVSVVASDPDWLFCTIKTQRVDDRPLRQEPAEDLRAVLRLEDFSREMEGGADQPRPRVQDMRFGARHDRHRAGPAAPPR